MRFGHFVVLALGILLTACADSPSEKGTVTETPGQTSGAQDGDPLEGTVVQPGDYEETGIRPGTQQDLVVNVGDRVFFGFDRYDLTSEARETLEQQAKWLRQYPHINVTIEGHTDERGTRVYNLALGARRAMAVKKYLEALGIDESRISTISYGKERPAVPESNPEAWAQNRRAVTVIE